MDNGENPATRKPEMMECVTGGAERQGGRSTARRGGPGLRALPSRTDALKEGCKFGWIGFHCAMQTLERIEKEVKRLSKAEQESLRDWLENMLEDDLEFTDGFKAKIERGEQDIRAGRVRIRKP